MLQQHNLNIAPSSLRASSLAHKKARELEFDMGELILELPLAGSSPQRLVNAFIEKNGLFEIQHSNEEVEAFIHMSKTAKLFEARIYSAPEDHFRTPITVSQHLYRSVDDRVQRRPFIIEWSITMDENGKPYRSVLQTAVSTMKREDKGLISRRRQLEEEYAEQMDGIARYRIA